MKASCSSVPSASVRATESPSPGADRAAEAELLERVRQGDDAACEVLIREHGGRMFAVARRLLRHEDDAHDAVQEAFLQAFRAIDSFRGVSTLATWLHRIVTNAALMKRRTAGRRPEISIEELMPQFDESGHHVRSIRDWSASPASALMQQETREIVHDCIDRLPAPYREILILRDIEECETDEVAKMLGITAGSVKTRLHRARQALRTLLEPMFAR